MAVVQEIFDVIDQVAPFSQAMEFDNVGLLVGDLACSVSKVLLALDITPEVVAEAEEVSAGLVISHHPVIFHPLKRLDAQSVPYLLAEKGIAALCCHTNLDLSQKVGVNVALARRLGLEEIKGELACGSGYILYSGMLREAMAPETFAAYGKERLNSDRVRLVPGQREVRKVCLCSGAGGEYLAQAAQAGGDAFLTGELRHHEALEAAALGITALEAGHYETEKPFGELLASYLSEKFPQTEFLLSKREKPPFLGR